MSLRYFTILLTFCSKGREPSRTNSHLDGTSKGELIPVNSLITPSLANLYKPLTSLFSQVSIELSTKISIYSPFSLILSRLACLSFSNGAIFVTIATPPCFTTEATNPILEC